MPMLFLKILFTMTLFLFAPEPRRWHQRMKRCGDGFPLGESLKVSVVGGDPFNCKAAKLPKEHRNWEEANSTKKQ